jgi:hypothetical protein
MIIHPILRPTQNRTTEKSFMVQRLRFLGTRIPLGSSGFSGEKEYKIS